MSAEATLNELARVGQSAHPRVALDVARFVAHVRRHLGADEAASLAAITPHAADLFLACACAAGVPAAIDELERVHIRRVPDFIARVDSSRTFADEVMQLLRERLLLRDGDRPPRIADYSGAGALDAWLRVASVRTAHNLKRSTNAARDRVRRQPSDPPPAPDATPEIAYLKARYGREMGDAFGAVLAKLAVKDKSLLMMHFVDGQSTTAIAAVHRVHPATVRRWIEQLRNAILTEAKRDLRARIGPDDANMTSLMELVGSQLDLSLSRLLRDS
jgi:RNA polymerase sigma-70 factor (ECF subfamily)